MAKLNLSDRLAPLQGAHVLVTGHTGFKGSWLVLWLRELGAEVSALALDPHTAPALYTEARVADGIRDLRVDIREGSRVREAIADVSPDAVMHLAAQPLVRASYEIARETFDINVMGTLHVLDAARAAPSVRAFVHVGTDKVYENKETPRGYVEDDPLGGHDPYSASKAAAEIVFQSFQRSFFAPAGRPLAASGRAGNVIGGGDWARDRIVPDAVRALAERRAIPVRNPVSTRPWQHVLEALSGYLVLAADLLRGDAAAQGSWNFGPPDDNVKTVRDLVEALVSAWGEGSWTHTPEPGAVHEAKLLTLCCDKAEQALGWTPRWDFHATVCRVARWYRDFHGGSPARALCLRDIREYMAS